MEGGRGMSGGYDAAASGEDLAIIGMAIHCPGAQDLTAFWDNLRLGRELVRDLTDEELDLFNPGRDWRAQKDLVRRGVVLEDFDRFDAEFFGFTPREAQVMDPQVRLLIQVVHHGLEDAGYDPADLRRHRVAVVSGVSGSHYLVNNVLPNADVVASVGAKAVHIGNDPSFVATQIAFRLDLTGPALNLNTACSTSLTALHVARDCLLRGDCDMAVIGASNIAQNHGTGYRHEPGNILARDGHCRPFDKDATGTVSSCGAGAVVLKRLVQAIADGDHVYAVVKGTGITNDGADKVSFSAPSVTGQAGAISAALAQAGDSGRMVGYVEAHGTGTALGDPIEVEALHLAYRERLPAGWRCRLGSLKANMGHMGTAAGIGSLIKAALTLHHRKLLPQINFTAPNPNLGLDDSPFYVGTDYRDWEVPDGVRRVAAVSAFGRGGTNVHVVLEEAPAREPGTARRPALLPVSAKSEESLTRFRDAVANHAASMPGFDVNAASWTLVRSRAAMPLRDFLIAEPSSQGMAILASGHGPTPQGKLVFAFPGYGSQWPGMARDLYRARPRFAARLDACIAIVEAETGIDIGPYLLGGAAPADAARLGLDMAQPILFSMAHALATDLMAAGVRPDALIGHSTGEWVAAAVSGVVDPDTALRVVCRRNGLMVSMRPGAMLSVQLAADDARRHMTDGIELSADNAPRACVLSGSAEAIESLAERLAAAGVRCRQLNSRHAFHSTHMLEAAAAFKEFLDGINLAPPAIPFVSNVTGTWITVEQAMSPDYWGRHIHETVRYREGVECVLSSGRAVLVEVGSGQSMTGLHHGFPTVHPRECLPCQPPAGQFDDGVTFLRAVGELWKAKYLDSLTSFVDGTASRRIPLPGYPFRKVRYWLEAPTAGESRTRFAPDPVGATARFHVPTWCQADIVSTRSEPVKRFHTVAVVAPDEAAARSLRGELSAVGDEILTLSVGRGPGCRDPRDPSTYTDFIEALCEQGRRPDLLVYALGLDPHHADSAVASAAGVVTPIPDLCRALQSRNATRLTWVTLTQGAAAITGNDPLHPHRAVLPVATRVIGQEFPDITTHCIDLDETARTRWLGRIVARELVRSEPAFVAYRGIKAFARRFAAVEIPSPEPAGFRREGVYLVTGGLGGAGRELAKHMARNGAGAIALLQRSRLEDMADSAQALIARNDMAAMVDAGAKIQVVAVDIADEDALRACVAQLMADHGRINGLIHSAGTPGGGLLVNQRAPGIAATFRSKVEGTAALEACIDFDSLDFVVFCSSQNALKGGIGRFDYACANAYLDAVATAYGQSGSTRVRSINWNTWLDVGMAVDVKRRAGLELSDYKQQEGSDSAESCRMFAAALGLSASQLVVSKIDVDALLARHAISGAEARSGGTSRSRTARQPRPAHVSASFRAPVTGMEQRLCEIWADLLGVESVGMDDNFYELGASSLIVIRAGLQIKDELQTELPVNALYSVTTVAELMDLVNQLSAAAAADAGDELEDLMAELRNASDAEIEALLNSVGAGEKTP